MPNSPIRKLLFGVEAVPEVQAATLNTIYMDVESPPTSKDMFARQLIRVHNGTMVGATLKALGTRHSTLTLSNLPLFADQTAWLLSTYFGPPTSTQVGATGVYNHVFKLGPATEPKTASLVFYNGVRYKRMLGAVASTLKITNAKEESPRLDMEFLGHAAQTIEVPITFDGGSTPATVTRKAVAHGTLTGGVVDGVVIDDGGLGYTGTVVATIPANVVKTTAAALGAVTLTTTSVSAVAVTSGGTGYVPAPAGATVIDSWGPVSYRHLIGTINSTLSEIMSYTLSLNNNRAGRWTGRANADVRRFTRGLADNSLESMYDYVSYGGSYKAVYDAESDLGDWTAAYINTGVNIGSGTDNPAFTINVPNVILEDADEPDDGPEAVQTFTSQGSYASSPATSVVLTLKNTTASYAAS